MKTKLIVGLGNPGPEYSLTRHNAGFLAADYIADELFSSETKKKNYSLYKKTFVDTSVFLLKPLEYMNLSGRAVREIMNFFKINIQDILVIHDDIDLAPGLLRIKKLSGAGGHNGIRSIIECCGSNEFWRIKIGVGKNELYEVHDWVLSRFSDEELRQIEKLFSPILEIAEHFIAGDDLTSMMNRYNRKNS